MATITKADLLNPDGRLMPMLEEQAAHRRKHDAVIMAATLIFTALATALALVLVRTQENATYKTQFLLDSTDRTGLLQQELQRNLEMMQSLVAFFVASKNVEREEFEQFLASPMGQHPWVQSLQWAPLVSGKDRVRFEKATRDKRTPNFQITEQNGRGEIIRAGERAEYCPVTYLVPFESNQRAQGFDLLSEPTRRLALASARNDGVARASGRVMLVQGEEGFLCFAPVHRPNPASTAKEPRPATVAGFCVGVFRIRAIVEHALKSERRPGVNLALFDVTQPGGSNLLYHRSAAHPPEAPPSGVPTLGKGLQHRAQLDVAGRSWLIVSTPSAAYRAAFPRWQSWSTLGGGVLLMFFLSLSFIQHRRYADSLESRVARRTQELARAYRDIEGEINVRSQAENALRQNQKQLHAILNNTTAVVYVKDPQGHYLFVNQRYKWLFNVSDVSILGHTDHDIFPDDVADVLHANDLKALTAEAPVELEEVVPLKTNPRTYLSVKFPLRDDSGKPYAVCGISTDITERKRMEEALKVSQQRYDLIITGIEDGIWDWNLDTNEVYFSPHWKCMLGYAEDEVKNTFSAWQELLHPDDAERASLTLQNFLDGHRPVYELEHRLRHRDGTYRWILARGVALRNAEGRPVRVVGSHVDLTERKKAEEELRQANLALGERERELTKTLADLELAHEQLQSTQLQLIQAEKLESIGKLAAGVAHEVKNPLQTMLMGLTYLSARFSGADEDVKLTCSDMRDAISRADSIVRGLLQMSGNPNLDMAFEDINAVLEKALSLLTYSLNATRITPIRRLDPSIPKVRLDLGKMEQVFINLLTNAIHAMPNGGNLYVSTFYEPDTGSSEESDSNGRVIVRIQDTGPGIPPDHLPRLFTPFFTTKQKGLGTGLGLSVTKSIVELHGGHIDLANAPEGGARVTVTLHAGKEHVYEKSTDTVCR
jgi:PAS domain S-box-containing protein